ncbi:MAG: c-type cytochrome [Phycisphaerales bacterium]|nr:c-type cytochrome [Phycisphaerales bacterium]
MRIARHGRRIGILAISGLTVTLPWACAGPIPLSRAIWPQHDQEFRDLLATHPASPKESWYAWQAKQHDITVAQAAEDDAALSTTRNPFNAKRDPDAVSRGAIIYRAYCQRCHGEDARGDGGDLLADHKPRDMHAFAQRFAATLHGGAPRAWFRKINEGFGDTVAYADGPSTAMPAFGDKLAREQIWLAITYLQSLDVYQQDAPADTPSTS